MAASNSGVMGRHEVTDRACVARESARTLARDRGERSVAS